MTAIIVLLLLVTWGGRTAFADDFHKSQFKLQLSSNGNPKNIPQLFDCSCELIVFPVYNSSFTATISLINRSYTRAKILFKQSSTCQILTFDDKNQATLDVQNEVYDNQDQITQTIIIQLIGSDAIVSDDCEGIQNVGETRIVYIIRVRENKYIYQIKLPMNAEWVTQIIAIIVLLILPQNIKYRRRVPFQFGFVLTIVYSGFLFATVYVQVMLSSDLNLQITFWGIMMFSFGCMVLYLADLFSIFIQKIWIVWSLSVICSLAIISADAFILPDAWFINDIIAILVAAALIKFVVIKKLKAALFPILILWVFFIFRHFFVIFRLENFQQALSINIIPLFLQIPAIINDDQKGYICSAFATSKIITMGLILNYCVRIDLFLSNHFYTIISTTIACICLILELAISFLADDLPVTEYSSCILFIPITLISILLLASKRGEWAEVWHGSFHDIAVDRKSIRKEQSQLNDEEMYRNLDHLQLNPSVLSD